MRVSLAPTHRQPPPVAGALPQAPHRDLLSPMGPRVLIGGELGADGLAQKIEPRNHTLFGPRAACLAAPEGPLYVCDTGHHRLMVWHKTPLFDHTPADLVIGQRDFSQEGRNAKGDIGASTLNVPTGVAAADNVVAVADAWNHRVLIWLHPPEASNQPADVVLGQADFSGSLANRGADRPTAATLNWCYGVTIASGRLYACDTGNRRVLVWNTIPTRHGTPADLVIGQRDFVTRNENAGGPADALGMRWPHALAVIQGRVLVTDAGNNRVMVWQASPTANGQPCDFVLGQCNTSRVDHNRAGYYPAANAMSMPYGLTCLKDRLVVADTANSRLIGFDTDDLAMGVPATYLAGQHDFTLKGDNRWEPAVRDSLCWPYGVAACGNTLVVADSGNSRVSLWEAAP